MKVTVYRKYTLGTLNPCIELCTAVHVMKTNKTKPKQYYIFYIQKLQYSFVNEYLVHIVGIRRSTVNNRVDSQMLFLGLNAIFSYMVT